jgi:hypothetical protein
MCGGKGGEKEKETSKQRERIKKYPSSYIISGTPFSVRIGLGPSSTITPSLFGGTRCQKTSSKKRPVATIFGIRRK